MPSLAAPEEIRKFDAMAADWWAPDGPMRMLHRFNPVRLAWIWQQALAHFQLSTKKAKPLAGLRVLDIGCGGGLLCEALAQLGAKVSGLDESEKMIGIAQAHAQQSQLDIDYRCISIADIPADQRYDIILAMEVVEHVPDVAGFLRHSATHLTPRGLMFVATLNRTIASFALAIVGAEYVLRWLPRGTHSWHKFVTPKELGDALAQANLKIFAQSGVSYNPLRRQWYPTRNMQVNYMLCARR